MIAIVGGARPNFIKIAPIIKELRSRNVYYKFIHTGQHYDYEMSAVFITHLLLPEPDYDLEIGSGTHGHQTGMAIIKLEEIFIDNRPDIVIVVGDVNSTLAGAIAAVKLGIPVAHVEAGLRSFDRTMPEEINRLLTDILASFLFTTCEDAEGNLLNEGIPEERIFFVGNVMIDSLIAAIPFVEESTIHDNLKLQKGEYMYITLHRPSNVDDRTNLTGIVASLEEIDRLGLLMVFPIHPRTKKRLTDFGLLGRLESLRRMQLLEPLGYVDAIALEASAKVALTDSGGVQEETTFLKVPCLTLRPNTERPITITEGTNILLSHGPGEIFPEVKRILEGERKDGAIPRLWDGGAATRIVDILVRNHAT
jgi:UDP-N-acetylglucosamine 2-epimerase (non-hydrolysing)